MPCILNTHPLYGGAKIHVSKVVSGLSDQAGSVVIGLNVNVAPTIFVGSQKCRVYIFSTPNSRKEEKAGEDRRTRKNTGKKRSKRILCDK